MSFHVIPPVKPVPIALVIASFAARFAAKEAMTKAMGTGFTGGITWKDIEVLNKDSGRPEIILHGKVREIAESMEVRGIHLSISHDGDYAVAQVVLEG